MANKTCASSLAGISYKIFYFMFYGGYMPFLLFLPVYFKYMGLSAVYVGILAGIRPILQSIGTPFLVVVGEKFQSKRMLFVISCLVMVGRVLVVFLLLRPTNQRCTVAYINITDNTMRGSSHLVEHRLSKRSLVTDYWLKGLNDAVANNIFTHSAEESNIRNETKLNNTLHHQVVTSSENKASFLPNPGNKMANSTYNTTNNTTNMRTRSTLQAPPTKKANDIIVKYRLDNNDAEVYRIFIGLLVLGLLADCFEATIFTLVDHSYTANMENKQFGLTRLWGNLGWGIMTPVVGVVVYYFPHMMCGKIVGTYHYIFLFFIGFSNVALLVGSHLDFTSHPIDEIAKKIHSALSNFQYGLFLFASSYSGFCNGFLFTFINWFIDSLGGSALIMGIATGCKCVVDVLLFFLLQRIIDDLGHMATIGIGFFGHIMVFLAFYIIKSPWLVVIVETVHAIVYALMTSTCVSFLIYAAPAGSSPRMQGILQGIYWGIGTGCGAIFGGYCLEHVGFPQTFLIFTVITCIVAFVFFVVQMMLFLNDPETMNEIRWERSSNFDGDDEESSSGAEDEENYSQNE